MNPIVFDYIKDDNSSWEEDCLPILIKEKELNAFKHEGFWHPMDTLRDKKQLEKIILKRAPIQKFKKTKNPEILNQG